MQNQSGNMQLPQQAKVPRRKQLPVCRLQDLEKKEAALDKKLEGLTAQCAQIKTQLSNAETEVVRLQADLDTAQAGLQAKKGTWSHFMHNNGRFKGQNLSWWQNIMEGPVHKDVIMV